MKKVFSNLSLIFLFPMRFLRKVKINNFLGGLILGAIISLIVNIATVQIQEIIKKQRILEALENEILNNLLTANNILEFNNQYLKDKTEPLYLYSPKKYSRDLWEQSAEPLQYISQLDRETQNKISVYYSFVLPGSMVQVEKIDYIARERLFDCYLKIETLTATEKNQCSSLYTILISAETLPADWISKASYELLQVFQPTRDRQNNVFLRLILGNESTRPLSDK